MSRVISVRLNDSDFEKLLALGDKREIVSKGIRLLYAVKLMDVNDENEKLQVQTSISGDEIE